MICTQTFLPKYRNTLTVLAKQPYFYGCISSYHAFIIHDSCTSNFYEILEISRPTCGSMVLKADKKINLQFFFSLHLWNSISLFTISLNHAAVGYIMFWILTEEFVSFVPDVLQNIRNPKEHIKLLMLTYLPLSVITSFSWSRL